VSMWNSKDFNSIHQELKDSSRRAMDVKQYHKSYT